MSETILASEEELELRKKGYILGVTLGEGSYAKVKSALHERSQKRVAIKIINRKRAPKVFKTKFLPRELQILKEVSHPNIVKTYEILDILDKTYIVMEHAGHGDLLMYIKLRGAIPEERAKEMYLQLLNAVEYLHARHIVHRDLKCENILLDNTNLLKLSDFGFARHFRTEDMCETYCGSAAYAAPEVLRGKPYIHEYHDIWSLGVILYIMVTGSMPFNDANIGQLVQDQKEKRIRFSSTRKVSDDCKDLILKILEPDVGLRATIRVMRIHAWMASIDKKSKEAKERSSKQTEASGSKPKEGEKSKPKE